MRRLFALLIVIACGGFALARLADLPADIHVRVSGYEFTLRPLVALLLGGAAFAILYLVVQTLRALWHGPEAYRLFWRTRRARKGLNAIAQGLVAVGAWDARRAARSAAQAENYLGATPLTLLLRSQVAQLTGDHETARTSFKTMLSDPETRLLGLRGLYVEAERAGDATLAADYAAAAATLKSDLPWALHARLMTSARHGHWDEVLSILKQKQRARLLSPNALRQMNAVALTAKARDGSTQDSGTALSLYLQALRFDPGLVPAALGACALLAEQQAYRKATRLLEASWRVQPHPDIAQRYIHLRKGDSARDRLKRARVLARLQDQHPESLIALATAAAEMRDFENARALLAPLLNSAPSQRLCLLMAKCAEAEDHAGGMREWLDKALRAPRDACWVADGRVTGDWVPLGPVSGQLGACAWKIPDTSPRGALLLQDQLPDIPAAVPGLNRIPPRASTPALPPGLALSPVPFVPDDPGVQDEEGAA